jgi:hypothetical protein
MRRLFERLTFFLASVPCWFGWHHWTAFGLSARRCIICGRVRVRVPFWEN